MQVCRYAIYDLDPWLNGCFAMSTRRLIREGLAPTQIKFVLKNEKRQRPMVVLLHRKISSYLPGTKKLTAVAFKF